MDYALSDSDIRVLLQTPPNIKGFLPTSVNIVPYTELGQYNSIDGLFSRCNCCIILYQEEINSGHWVCLFKRNKTIYFFDSYGIRPDRQQHTMSESVRKRFYEDPELIYLMYHSPYKIDYNPYQFQADGMDIATCGRHCIVRLWNRGKNADQYKKWVDKVCKKHTLNPDELVYLLTCHL